MAETNRQSSLLKQHLKILGLEAGALDQAAQSEQKRMAGIELLDLSLPRDFSAVPGRKTSARPRNLAPYAALAAALVLGLAFKLFFTREPEIETLRVKGENKVWVFWERDGDVHPWAKGAVLKSGDRVRAEVLAADDVTAFSAVVDARGVLLSDPTQIEASKLRLKAGEKASFEGSLKLVGDDEGETLLVVVCSAGSGIEGAKGIFPAQGDKVAVGAFPSGCVAQDFGLRGDKKQ